jgi:branched-chain amino acid transport system permease protein
MVVFYIGLGLAVVATGMVYALLRSRHGLALTAMRDSEPASESIGVNTYRAKLVVYVVAAAVTGVIGALIYLQNLRISPDAAFNVIDWTAYVIFIVVIGGIGRIEGPIIGTVIFFVLRQTLADLGSLYLLMMGAVAIAVMLFAPQGLWGVIVERLGWQALPLQRRLVIADEPKTGTKP